MTERELLEAAAKAAGYVVRWQDAMNGGLFLADKRGVEWNPLTDDGDALRLAVKLRLQVHIEDYGTAARPTSELPQVWVGCEAGNLAGDHAAATRLAIVRAAGAARNGEG